jgi:hypothetical protein
MHGSGSPVHTSRGAGLTDPDLGKVRQLRREAIPDPLGEHFAGRILETLDLIEVIVVELGFQRLEGRLEIPEVLDPSGVVTDRPEHVYLNLV